jgi:hypothetical protein
MEISEIPTQGLAQYVAELARAHGITYSRTPDDALAEIITHLSDDDVATDETEDLLVALKRASIIDAETLVQLLGSYLDEVPHVRPVQRF